MGFRDRQRSRVDRRALRKARAHGRASVARMSGSDIRVSYATPHAASLIWATNAYYAATLSRAAIAAPSIFFIVIIAANARLACPPSAAIASVSVRGAI